MGRIGVLVDKILDYLSDNRWGEIGDLAEITGLKVDKVVLILEFLEKFDFVSVDADNGKVELTDVSMKIVVPRMETLEGARTPLRRVP